MLTDKLIIKARAESAMSQDPGKFQGHAAPSPGTVLEYLGRLTGTAMHGTGQRPISRDGKNWLLNLGEPCVDLMKYIGFTSNVRTTVHSFELY